MPTYKGQLEPGKSTNWKRLVKRAFNKFLRRQAKKNPEDIQPRKFSGYA